MKIIYVDMKYDYGDPKRGLSPIGNKGFYEVFKSLGHEVQSFYFDEYLNDLDSLQKNLIEFVDAQKPDMIYFMLYTDQFYPETLLKLKSKYITVSWFGDDHFRFDNFTYKYAPLFSYCVTTDHFSISKYKKIGVENIILSQWAALNVPIDDESDLPYQYEISFVGGFHPVRKWIIDEFRKAGLRVEAFGFKWPHGSVSLEKMIQIFKTSKINLNLTNSVNLDLRFLFNGPTNLLRSFISAKNVSQIKARSFEIPYYGGFQLTGYVPMLEDYYSIGKEVACYSEVSEAISLAKYYLENDELRENIKKAGVQKARQNHTYKHRHQEVFKKIAELTSKN